MNKYKFLNTISYICTYTLKLAIINCTKKIVDMPTCQIYNSGRLICYCCEITTSLKFINFDNKVL
jgi:hypothetical protein